MKFTKVKIIQILSNGSLNFCYMNFLKPKQFTFYEKDQKNFYLNKKTIDKGEIKSDYFSEYKKKYLISK
jgi:hypothetical protein